MEMSERYRRMVGWRDVGRHYAPQSCCNAAPKGVLQIRNNEFFSLESCPVIDIIRDAMAGHKTDTYGHNPNPALAVPGSKRTNHTTLGDA
jgi:hypothetical protein